MKSRIEISWGRFLALAGCVCLAVLRMQAAEPLAVFECREHLDRDWPRTIVTYQREFPAGTAREGNLVLTAEIPPDCGLLGSLRGTFLETGADLSAPTLPESDWKASL